MKIRIFALTFISIFVLTALPISIADAALPNGNFDSWDGAHDLTTWTETFTTPNNITQEISVVKAVGGSSVKANGSTMESATIIRQTVAVTIGNNYTFSVWALDNAGGSSDYVDMDVSSWGHGGSVSNNSGTGASDSPVWRQLSVQFVADAANIDVRIFFMGWSATYIELYVDSAEFYEGSLNETQYFGLVFIAALIVPLIFLIIYKKRKE